MCLMRIIFSSAPSYMIHGLWPFIAISAGPPSWSVLVLHTRRKASMFENMTPFYPSAPLGWRGIVVAWAGRRIGDGQHPEPCGCKNCSWIALTCCKFIGIFSTSKSQKSLTLTFVWPLWVFKLAHGKVVLWTWSTQHLHASCCNFTEIFSTSKS